MTDNDNAPVGYDGAAIVAAIRRIESAKRAADGAETQDATPRTRGRFSRPSDVAQDAGNFDG